MPCNDWGSGPGHTIVDNTDYKTIKRLSAMLCAILSVDSSVINRIDEQEAGVKKTQILAWWKEHQEEDRRRRDYERKERERAAKKKAAMSKLTADERRLLGLR